MKLACATQQAAPVEASNYTNFKYKNYFKVVGCNLTEFQVCLHTPPWKIETGLEVTVTSCLYKMSGTHRT